MGLMKEYINRRMSSKNLWQELLKLIGKYNKLRGTYLVVYASAIAKHIPDVSLTIDDYYVLFDILKDAKSDKLDFYIETPGGRGEAAEEIVRFIRNKFKEIVFVVSGEAKSAGTLLVLSGDEIMMTKSGSLGPIDAQMRVGRFIISAYDYITWVQEIREEAEKKGVLNPFDATMIAQISPGELSGVNHSLNFAIDLVKKWLPKYKFKNWNVTETRKIRVTPNMKKNRAKEIAKDLIKRDKWRTHARSIKIDDLEGIGLKITKIDDDPKLSDVVYRIQMIIRLLFSSTGIYKIFATEEGKIFKQAVPSAVPPKIPAGKADIAEFAVKCQKCGKVYKFYVKFVPNPKIDEDFKKKGYRKFPKGNKFKCDCGFEIDLTGARNDIETKVGKKIIL